MPGSASSRNATRTWTFRAALAPTRSSPESGGLSSAVGPQSLRSWARGAGAGNSAKHWGVLRTPSCPCRGAKAFTTPGIFPSPGIKSLCPHHLPRQCPYMPASRRQAPPGTPLLSSPWNCPASHSRSTSSAPAFPGQFAFVSCRHPWDPDLRHPLGLGSQGQRRHWLCGTEHSPIPTFLWGPLLPGTKGNRAN